VATTTPADRPPRQRDPRRVDPRDKSRPGRFPGDLIELIETRRQALGAIPYDQLAARAGAGITPDGHPEARISQSSMHDYATIPRKAYPRPKIPAEEILVAIADALTGRDCRVTVEMVTVAAAASLGIQVMPREPGADHRVLLLGPRTARQIDALRNPFGLPTATGK
jgi:hypothetical protein